MSVRMAAVAGQFYESHPDGCRDHIAEMLEQYRAEAELPEQIVAGVVPHAGWAYSGALAGMVFASLAGQKVDTFVIFGAVHAVRGRKGMLYDTGQWGSPLGTIEVDEQLAEAILAEGGELIEADYKSHSREHSIEVQIPFIQYLFPEAQIVPLMVPPSGQSGQIGEAAARAMERSGKQVVCIGSTDLTHYGPSYLFTPMGTGAEALRWAKEENDKFFLDLALSMQAEKLVETAQSYGSACGAGAVAATVAAARQLGAEKGYLLAHRTSAEITAEKYGEPGSDSVGYAAIVYGRET
jgi:AmmeMemoRadiSam system protein B